MQHNTLRTNTKVVQTHIFINTFSKYCIALVCCMGPVYHNRSSKDRRQLTNKMHQKWQKWQQLAPKHIFFLNSEAYQVQPNTHTWRSLIHIFSKIFLLLAIFSLIMQCTARLTFSPLVQCISMFD